MSDFPPDVILDANGDPIGRYRPNQDPTDITRLHPVPKTNAHGEPIFDGGEIVVAMLPLDDPRTTAQLEREGLQLHDDGMTLIAIEGHPETDKGSVVEDDDSGDVLIADS